MGWGTCGPYDQTVVDVLDAGCELDPVLDEQLDAGEEQGQRDEEEHELDDGVRVVPAVPIAEGLEPSQHDDYNII